MDNGAASIHLSQNREVLTKLKDSMQSFINWIPGHDPQIIVGGIMGLWFFSSLVLPGSGEGV